MSTKSAPLFTPRHVRELLDLPAEQLRNWRRHLPAIGRERSGQAVFDFADLLALAVMQRLVNDVGIRIGTLEPLADQLVEVCRFLDLDIAALERLEIDFDGCAVAIKRLDTPMAQSLVLALPLGPIVKSLLGGLTTMQDGHGTLPLFR